MGFAVASLISIILSNTVVPMWGYGIMFYVLGSMAVVSMIMSFYFYSERTLFIPFENDRPCDDIT